MSDYESSDTEVTVASEKKPRKKSQAFGVARTAAKKAQIDRNAKASPLLRLPLEIRKRIWTFTIGNRLLHIDTVNCELHKNHQPCWCSEKFWRTSCCFAPHSEDSIFERSKIPIDDLITTDEASCSDFVDSTLTQQLPSDAAQARELRKAAITGHPHNSCRALIANLRSGQKETLGSHQLVYHKRKEYALPVQLLRVCRQIYIESNPLLWSTNTLSFENMTNFKTFMSNRIRAQRANITSLHLDLTDNYYSNSRYASSAATLGILTSLVGLRSLHVYLSDNIILDPLVTMAGDDESAQIDNWKDWVHEESGGKELTNYRILDLTNVTVLMAIAKIGVFRYPPALTASHSLEQWRRGERTDYAETIRQTILDADGAQKLKKEQADAKAARAAEKAEMEETKLTDPPCLQASTVDECAGMTQKRRKNGKAPPCPKDHVCLICFNDLDKSRDDARQCPKPGACVDGYFKIHFNNKHGPTKCREVSIHANDTIREILSRYAAVGRINIDWNWALSLSNGTELKYTSTVREVGLKSGDQIDLTINLEEEKGETVTNEGTDFSDEPGSDE